MAKYIFVTGGVVSSLGKGITASCIGRLLKNRGLKVFMQKFDPYINVDPGTMSPYQHGEVFVTDDGAETDLDLGHYERFIDENLSKDSNITSGKIYKTVIEKERRGDYNGGTVQVIPHVTNEIKNKIRSAAEHSQADVIITEIGGTVGDIESQPFLEAIRQWRREVGYENTFYIHTTLVPFLRSANEIKTKPTQHSVKELRSLGIQPDMIVLRSEVDIDNGYRDKISLFCDVDRDAVVIAKDVNILYEMVCELEKQKVDQYICHHFRFETAPINMKEWNELIKKVKKLQGEVKIALVGKYTDLRDAYLSISEALKHAGYYFGKKTNIDWINSEKVNSENVDELLQNAHGILVPSGFGPRGIEGKILACNYARKHKIPYFGICLGMQIAVIEYMQNVVGLKSANSTEFDEKAKDPVIDYLPEQYKNISLIGTMRLGLYDCKIKKDTRAYHAYQKTEIKERHRNNYELNNQYLEVLEKSGMIASGINPQTNLVEIVEIVDHPWFVACQFHPEFLSRPQRAHPLFVGFLEACIKKQK